MQDGTAGLVLGFVGLLLMLAGLALPEGGTSTAIHVVAIGVIVGAFVFLARLRPEGTRASVEVGSGGGEEEGADERGEFLFHEHR